uniref:Transposase n=1 Tax=Streptomyces sp. NBC_00008 TaxID=2903610 RepID=A0AAU2VTR7_9ACTN
MRRPQDAEDTLSAVRRLRPKPPLSGMPKIPDSKVGQLLTLLDRTGVPQELEDLLRDRPGPKGVRPRVVLAGLLLSAYYTGRATVADAWRLLHYGLEPRARTWLGIPEHPPAGPAARIASSKRLYRGLNAITTALDPARYDRRSRLPQRHADFHAALWDSPEGRTAAARLQLLANRLVLASVRMADQRGYLRGWNGDVGVDATDIRVSARPDSSRLTTASTEVTAGWHFKGGTGDKVFGYSASLAIAAHHRDPGDDAPGAYPQLCLGFELDTPTVRTGPNALTILTQITQLGLPTGILAADRAYTGCSPSNFQTPVRRLGYRLALDYKVKERGLQGSWQGAPLVDGSLLCPLTPAPLIHATAGADDDTVRFRSDALREKIEAREPHHLKLKQGPNARGAIRLQCPASGPSPSVNCTRRDRLRPRAQAPAAMPSRVIDLSLPLPRTLPTAARPTVQVPDAERFAPPPAVTLPQVCCAGSITVPADTEANWRLAKYRQDVHYLHTPWLNTYRPIRSHNEGANGRFKSGTLDVGNPKHRPAPGQVAQTLLLAVMLTVANLTVLETWLTERAGPDELTDADFDATGPLPSLDTPRIALPEADNGRHPPPRSR